MRKAILLIFTAFICLSSCNKSPKQIVYVGVDPAFFPLELFGKEPNLLGFCNEILQEIGAYKKCHFERMNVSWEALLEGLHGNKYQAILSSMQPYVFNEKKYAFSHLFLLTGPVLVVPEGSKIKNFKMLEYKEVVSLDLWSEQLLVDIAPDVLPRRGDTISKSLLGLKLGRYDAAFIPSIPAEGFVADLYAQELKIVTQPAGEAGLRFVTLNGDNEELVRIFNEGLKHLMKSGKYEELLIKWKL